MGTFHVIDRSIWRRVLFIIALLSVATLIWWTSTSQREAFDAIQITLFDKWLAQDATPRDVHSPAESDVVSVMALEDHGIAVDGASRVRVEPILSGFFDEYRIERDRSRSLQIEQLRELLTHSASSIDAETQESLMKLLQRSEQELQAEGVLRARGISEALVVLADAGAIVVVTDTVTQSEAGSIGQVVAGVTGIPLEHITISDGVIAR